MRSPAVYRTTRVETINRKEVSGEVSLGSDYRESEESVLLAW